MTPIDESTDIQDELDTTRRKRAKQALVMASGLAVAGGVAVASLISKRSPGGSNVAGEVLAIGRAYAPRPNLDVSERPRNALGQFTSYL